MRTRMEIRTRVQTRTRSLRPSALRENRGKLTPIVSRTSNGHLHTTALFSTEFPFPTERESLPQIQVDHRRIGYHVTGDLGRSNYRRGVSDQVALALKHNRPTRA